LDVAVANALLARIPLDTRKLSAPAFQLYLRRRGADPSLSTMGD
jgi:hypothetical protein